MIERICRALGYTPTSVYESEWALRIAAQQRSYEFFNKYMALRNAAREEAA